MRYYSTLRPISIGCFPHGHEVTEICNFQKREFVEKIGREAWGYIEFSHTLSKQNQISYELLPGGGMSERQFRSQFAGVLTEKEIDRLSAYSVFKYKKAHGITKVSESDRAIARLELMQYLFNMVNGDIIENLMDFFISIRITADVRIFGEHLINLRESTMVD